MLRAKRRLLKSGGRLAFFVLALADDLTAEEFDRALDLGPEHAPAGDGYPALLDEAGFDHVEFIDVTGEYRTTLEAWTDEWETEAAGIIKLIGVDEFAERRTRRLDARQAIDEGLLVRWLVAAS